VEHAWDKVRRRAEAQAGRVAAWQLAAAGITPGGLRSAITRGVLIPRLPRVYALGHAAPDDCARLWEGILYAGPGAMLSHDSAAHHRGYIDFPPARVHVSTPRKLGSAPGIVVHGRRRGLSRHLVGGLPVTSREQTALDLAAHHDGSARILRRMLSQMDYLGEYEPGRLHAVTGRGVPGSRALKQAMLLHNPSLARLNGPLEEDLYALLEVWHLQPLPDLVNVEIAPGLRPDAAYREYGVAIETDGRANHASPAQRTRDLGQELAYRTLGYTLLRYDWPLIHGRPRAVHDDILTALARAASERNLPPPTSGLRPRT
jgi:hypothetical protein